jgi:hypothetical protein
MRMKESDLGPTATASELGCGGEHERPESGAWWSALETAGSHGLNAGTSGNRSGDAPIGCSYANEVSTLPNTSSHTGLPAESKYPRVFRSGALWRRPSSDIHAEGWT